MKKIGLNHNNNKNHTEWNYRKISEMAAEKIKQNFTVLSSILFLYTSGNATNQS